MRSIKKRVAEDRSQSMSESSVMLLAVPSLMKLNATKKHAYTKKKREETEQLPSSLGGNYLHSYMISCCPRGDQRDYVNKEAICIMANYCTVQRHKQSNQRNCGERHKVVARVKNIKIKSVSRCFR